MSVIDFTFGINTFTVPCPNVAAHDAIVVADVNGDGKLDIVMANTYVGLSVLLNTTMTLADTTTAVSHTNTPGVNVKIYPNPFSAAITIEAPDKFFATIYTTVGRVVGSEEGRGRLVLNETSLFPGTYILAIEDSNHNALSRTLIIKR